MKHPSGNTAKLLHRHFALFLCAAALLVELYLLGTARAAGRGAEAQELFLRWRKHWEQKP